jgi:hypothetical protein
MFSMGISGALWKDILRIAIGWNKSDRPIANHGYSYGNLSNPMWKMIKPPEAFNCHGKFMGIVFFLFCFTKPNEANTSCIHVLVSWLVLKQFSIFLLSYRSTSLET